MKIWNKKILNKAVTFLLMAVLLCFNAVQVEAYTADTSMTGYPFIIENSRLRISTGTDYVIRYTSPGEQNSYSTSLDAVDCLNWLEFGDYEKSFIFPYNPEVFDYYLVGTMGFTGNADTMKLVLNRFSVKSILSGSTSSTISQDFPCEIYDFHSMVLNGFSFSANLSGLDNSNLSVLFFDFDDTSYISACDFWFSASIVPVPKASEAEQLNQSILNELIKINQNLVTSNSLQQSTIDAINQHDANEKSWFQQLIQSMGIGFSTLYEQMKKEQDDKLYGYQDTTTSEAASAFSSESDKLTALEGESSTQSNTYVTDYAAEGFDLGVLATIGSSLIFVTTWFTNFWNMGGVFTACLNFCFALSIVFFILRIKR